MGLEAGPVMPLMRAALAVREVHDGQSIVCLQVVWPWSLPFPFPDEERVCLDMITTTPSVSQKRKV